MMSNFESNDIVVPPSFDQPIQSNHHNPNQHHHQKNSVQFPTPPDSAISLTYSNQSTSIPTSAVLIDKYLTAYSNQLISDSSHQDQQQNTIEFPLSSSTTLKRKADVLLPSSSSKHLTNPNINRRTDEPIRAMHRWLIRTYESDQSSVVPEIDIRVKFKGLCDRLERTRMIHLDPEPMELVKEVFPGVAQEIRVMQGSIRSNEEHVIRGLRYRRRVDSDCLAQLDLRSSIPLELHSSQLIEALRERVNELEDELEFETEINKRARLMSSRRESDEMIRQTGSSSFTIDAQSDHSTNATSVHSIDTSSMSLAERIWTRLKIECRASNVRFEEGKKVTISWYDEVQEADFNAIVPFQTSIKPNRKPHSIRIINLTSEQINEELFSFNSGLGLVGNHWTYLKNKGKNIYLLKKNFKCVGLMDVKAEEGVVTYSSQTSQATFNFSVGLTNSSAASS
ncbi:uncharacterized protein MELLADRAFT_116245 [Melampsora larici-populina 98AG31]|uniref:Uncharacterized protein n=1 Tax=Melampsora larici-populina (strain 98AG31 / pathotype 3-4-7) TaxID=747676 RepID=F4RJD8_MELLP|nr:uncharacterized protein MELLADRAFT_116245 [Melampsora larici-populina 98AG31]EGG07516.1 hypothetical protein MELLADRAFT_116245 [Melampsora larici-populina 98AG31]